jgi:16S rRNA (cytidine1402-2'-O)-methyltransferase
VRVIPGPSAVTTALAACGFRAEQFVFLGFLPGRDSRKRKLLSRADALEVPIVIYESPHQIVQTVTLIGAALPHRPLFIGREMTKIYEQFFRGSVTEVMAALQSAAIPNRGEFTIVLGPPDPAPPDATR